MKKTTVDESRVHPTVESNLYSEVSSTLFITSLTVRHHGTSASTEPCEEAGSRVSVDGELLDANVSPKADIHRRADT